MKRLEFGFFDAGGGHRAAATAVRMAIEAESHPWETHLLNLQELLDPLDILRKRCGLRIEDFYNSMLRNGWTLGSAQLLKLLQLVVRFYHRPTLRLMEAYWRKAEPDMVVSFVPHFNRALYESFSRVFRERPFVTILTDLADYPPHFWIEPNQPQYFICGTERAVEQARSLGHPPERIFRASGMILHPRFYDPVVTDRTSEREQLGLERDWPTGVVLFGGHGSKVMLEIAERIEASGLPVQMIYICGKNERLAGALRAKKSYLPRLVEGFTTRVNYYMQLADFFIGKPGPGSVSEALATGLPVIVESNAWTLPQERYNARWITEKQVGVVLRSFRSIHQAVAEMVERTRLERYRAQVASIHNRAVFEIPAILEEIFERSRASACSHIDQTIAVGPP